MSETEEFISEKEIQVEKKAKPKRQPTEAQLLHLENIRVKAFEKKKQMKEITEKAKKQQEIESGKLQKKLEKEQLAKKYEETLEKAKLEKIEVSLDHKSKPDPILSGLGVPPYKPALSAADIKPQPKPEPKPEPEKKKKIKKIIYQEASDDDVSVEEVIVKRKPKAQTAPPQMLPPVVPPPQPSFHELVYQSSLDKLKNRITEDRCRHILNSVMPSYN